MHCDKLRLRANAAASSVPRGRVLAHLGSKSYMGEHRGSTPLPQRLKFYFGTVDGGSLAQPGLYRIRVLRVQDVLHPRMGPILHHAMASKGSTLDFGIKRG